MRPPRWLDLRLVLGVLLVLGSVLLGARVVGAADATVPVWAAAGDLAAGHRLDRGRPRAPSTSGSTTPRTPTSPPGTQPEGRTLARAVRAGELLPRSALDETDRARRSWPCPCRSGYVPPSLERGQLVDVYAVADPAAGRHRRRPTAP